MQFGDGLGEVAAVGIQIELNDGRGDDLDVEIGQRPPLARPDAISMRLNRMLQSVRTIRAALVGRMMNVGLHYRGVEAQLLPSSTPSSTAASTTRSLMALSVAGVSRLKLRLKASCLGTSSQ
jgi:hypothetical protein